MSDHSITSVRAIINDRCATRGRYDSHARYDSAVTILANVLQRVPEAAAIFDTDWRDTDALVARSDADALDALKRALAR